MICWKFLKYLTNLFVVTSVVFLYGCFQSDYTKLVKSELEKGIRSDSLLLGIKLGDTRNVFFGKCFDLNKQQLIAQGPDNTTVQYIFMDSLAHNEPTEIRLLFYPIFDEKEVIIGMDMEFSYTSWAPWNENFQADVLETKLMDLLKMWYSGNDFIKAKVRDKELLVKVDANRRILLSRKDAQSVIVTIHDILHPRFMHSISKK